MKKLLFLILSSILSISCGGDTENTMTVTGKVKGLKKGTLYLQKTNDSTLITLDSLKVQGDGSFVFKTELESPEIFYLYLNKKDNNTVNDRITFFGEPGIITINTTWNSFEPHAKIDGSETNKKLEEFQKMMTQFNKKNLEVLRLVSNSEIQLDSLQIDSVQKLSAKNMHREYAFALNFALNNKDSYIAPYIVMTMVPDANIKYLDSIYGVLNEEITNSKYGKELKEHLQNIKGLSQ